MPVKFIAIVYVQVLAIGCLTDCCFRLLLATRNRSMTSFQRQDLGRGKCDFLAPVVSHNERQIRNSVDLKADVNQA
jgi:hypothetical protein